MFSFMKERVTQEKWRLRDFIMTRGRPWASRAELLAYYLLKGTTKTNCYQHLMAAHRYNPSERMTNRIIGQNDSILWTLQHQELDTSPTSLEHIAYRSIILKNPIFHHHGIEKGVILIAFSESFDFFHKNLACDVLANFFHIVLEPSWAGYCTPEILLWQRYYPHVIVTQATEASDFTFLERLGSNLHPVSFGASDWVDFRLFEPLPDEKKIYDAIYVCNYRPSKRQHLLLRAIRKLGDRNFKAAMVFGKWGNAKKDIVTLVKAYGLEANIDLYDYVPPVELNRLLNRAKVNMLLSLKEGSNRSVFEGFFANVPGIVLKRNVGVKKEYFTPETGIVVNERDLWKALKHFRDHWNRYHARSWAMQNISPLITTQKLNAVLIEIANRNDEPWTKDIVAKVNSPELQYFSSNDTATMPASSSVLRLFLSEARMSHNQIQAALSAL